MEQTSEEICDALTLDSGCSPRAYADCLLSLAERLTPSRLERSQGMGMTPFRSQIGRRIESIVSGRRPVILPSARLRFAIVVAAASAATLGSWLISSADAPNKPNAATEIASHSLKARSSSVSSATTSPHRQSTDQDARILAGLTAVEGPGVVVILNDSQKSMPAAPPAAQMPFLIHDTDINQVVNALRSAGAEAISVNGQRLIATSSVRSAGSTILMNNMPIAPPYLIKAIGQSDLLAYTLKLPGSIMDELRTCDPAMIRIKPLTNIVIPAFHGDITQKYARPIRGTNHNGA